MRRIHTFIAALLLSLGSFAQTTPEMMSYQAVVRDADGQLVSDTAVGMRISILQNTTTGTAAYVEIHTPISNENGLVSIEIGTGSTSDDFSTIDWSAGPYFIKTETDPTGGSSYTITGTSQLMSVPFAMYAKSSGNGITTDQSDAIVANTAKVGYTEAAVSANTSVAANTLKVSYTQPIYIVNTFYAELGGYVIQISPNGKHGLVVAMQDQGRSTWYEANDLLSNPSNHDADGKEFSDWRLPTKRELNLMNVVYNNGNAASLTSNAYWSSTETGNSNAWHQDFFFFGEQYDVNKDNALRVRAVRAF